MKFAGNGKCLALALAAGLSVALIGTDALAWSYGSSGSWGSSGSSGSWGSSGSYGSSGSFGSHGGLFSRIRARRAARRAHSSYGSHGSYGGSGSYGSYAASGSAGSHSYSGSYGGSGSAGSYTHHHHHHHAAVTPSISTTTTSTGIATVNVKVPEGAIVVVNDNKTTSTGTERSYVSRGLSSGMTYTYNFDVTYEENGESVTRNEVVKLAAGETIELQFGGDTLASTTQQPADTELKLEVPADAKVFLLGTETKQTGSVRTFTTHQLKAGEKWEGYEIRVELEHEGQTLVREQQMTIEGGESYELAFDFGLDSTTQLAQLSR